MWPFSRRLPPVTSIPDEWSVGEGVYDADQLVVRWNTSIASIRGHQDYPYQVGVAIPFLPENGAPSRPSMERLAEFEETLIERVQAGFAGLVAAVLTTPRMREYLIYTQDPESTERQVERLRTEAPDLVVQSIVNRDPKWRNLRRLLP